MNAHKVEVPLNKSNIKWLYDEEQRDLGLKDIFTLEDTCLLDHNVKIN